MLPSRQSGVVAVVHEPGSWELVSKDLRGDDPRRPQRVDHHRASDTSLDPNPSFLLNLLGRQIGDIFRKVCTRRERGIPARSTTVSRRRTYDRRDSRALPARPAPLPLSDPSSREHGPSTAREGRGSRCQRIAAKGGRCASSKMPSLAKRRRVGWTVNETLNRMLAWLWLGFAPRLEGVWNEVDSRLLLDHGPAPLILIAPSLVPVSLSLPDASQARSQGTHQAGSQEASGHVGMFLLHAPQSASVASLSSLPRSTTL